MFIGVKAEVGRLSLSRLNGYRSREDGGKWTRSRFNENRCLASAGILLFKDKETKTR